MGEIRTYEGRYIYFDGPYIGNGEGAMPYLTLLSRVDLQRIRDAADATLQRYDELGWDDKEVRQQNNKVIDKWEEEVRERVRQDAKKEKEKKLDTRNLYLIHNAIQNTLKIGISVNPKERLRTLQLSTGDKLTLIFDVKGKAYLEKTLHKEFSDLRLASEWFKYDKRIVERFYSL